MRVWLETFKPAAPRHVHIILAALMWTVVGTLLATFGAVWTIRSDAPYPYGLIALALVIGAAKAHWVLGRAADRIIDRICSRGQGKCLGGFLSVRTWMMVLAMMLTGKWLRGGALSRTVVGPAYVAIGIALIIAARRLWMAWYASRVRVSSLNMERSYREIGKQVPSTGDRLYRMQAVVDGLWDALDGSGVSWVGFYLPDGDDALVLGPRRDKPACSPIGLHGACGQAFTQRRPIVVRDVKELGENYVACDPRDRSEVVVPLFDTDGTCWAVLDLDSHEAGAFSQDDVFGLTEVLEAAGLSAPRCEPGPS